MGGNINKLYTKLMRLFDKTDIGISEINININQNAQDKNIIQVEISIDGFMSEEDLRGKYL